MLTDGSAFQFESVLNAMDDGIVIMDRQGRVVFWNDWMARFARIESPDAVGKTIADLFPGVQATRLPLAIQESFESGSSSILTHSLNKLLPLWDESGNPLIHNVIVRPVSSGSSQQCLLQINDVTVAVSRERVLRERQNARYHAIVETAPDGIITINLDLSIQWLNSTAARIFGYQPAELIGRPIDVLLEDKNDLTASFLAAAHGAAPAEAPLQITGRRKDGRQVPFDMSMARWKADDRVFITTIWRDVTERIRAETALRDSEAQLRQANEELETRVTERTREREVALAQLFESQKLETIGQLTGGVAHDFNNLLYVILGSLSLLKKRLPGDARTTRLVDGAIQGAERGVTLTKRLLAFARRQDLTLQATALQTLVSEMTDFLRQSVGPGIQIVIDIPHDVDPVMTDANQLELALMNLAVNARDAMPEGGTLTVKARNETNDQTQLPASLPAGDYVRLTVADTGEGMDEATLARAMEPFFTTKGIGKGTGLGLSMVHGLTAQSGGGMDIASTPDQGTVISLWLPRAKPGDVMSLTLPEADTRETKAQALRILLVDDDALVSMNTANMLVDMGHDVVEVYSAAQALRVLESESAFDALITDFAMPGMNGLELATRVRSEHPAIRVILATGYAELPTSMPVSFPRLAKPFTQDQLSEIIARDAEGEAKA